MFGRDVYLSTLATMQQISMLSLEILKEAYLRAAINLKKAQDRKLGQFVKKYLN